MKLSLTSFQGELPVVADRLLPDNAASSCMNGRYEGGSLVPEREVYRRVDVVIPGGAKGFQITDETTIQNAFNNPPAPGFLTTIIAQDSWLIKTPTTGDIVRGPLASDAYDRWYIAQDGITPRVRYVKDGATGEKDLGVAPPVFSGSYLYQGASKSIAAFFWVRKYDAGKNNVWGGNSDYSWNGTGVDEISSITNAKNALVSDSVAHESVYSTYVATQVSSLGEESRPCDPSAVVERIETGGSETGVVIYLGTGLFADGSIDKVRIYRSDGGGEFGYVGELTRAQHEAQQLEQGGTFIARFVDFVPSSQLGESNITADWDVPDASMASITNVGAGLLAGYFGGTVCFCEPYYPHAWPVEYQYNFADNKSEVQVMGIVATAGHILVTTNSRPVLMFGNDPGSMSQQVVDIEAPNVSQRGLVDMGDYALYPTHDGLMMVSSSAAKLVTKGVFSKEQWQSLNPDTFVAFRYHEDYLCFHDGGAFIFSPDTGYFPIDPWSSSWNVEVLDGYYNPVSDSFWVMFVESSATRIVRFAVGDVAELRWKSKEFQVPRGLAFSSARVEGDEDVEFILTGDNGYSYYLTVTDDDPFRLPPGRPRKLSMELRSRGRITGVAVATSMQELY
ncbi:MAG: hypothetical protein K6L60_05690 [Oceanobacter sp.]